MALPLGVAAHLFAGIFKDQSNFPASPPVLQWSHDSLRVAVLVERERRPLLAMWRTDTRAEPEIIELQAVSAGLRPGERMVTWAWLSASNQLLVGIAAPVPVDDGTGPRRNDPVRVRRSDRLAPKDVWYLSHEPVGRFKSEEEMRKDWSPPDIPMRLVLFNLLTRDVRNVRVGQSEGGAGTGDLPTSQPVTLDQNALIAVTSSSSSDTEVPRIVNAGALRKSLWELDSRTGTIQRRYVSPPDRLGQISSAVRSGRGDFVITQGVKMQRAADSGGELNHRNFGRLYRLTPGSRHSVAVETDPIAIGGSRLFTADREAIVYHHTGRTATEARIFEVDLTNGRRERISPPDYSVTLSDVSANGRVIVAALESMSSPADLYVWRPEDRTWRQLTYYSKSVADLGLASVEKLTWKSKDQKFMLDGFLLKPPKFDPAKRHPLITIAKGGPYVPYRNEFGLWGSGVGGHAIAQHVLVAEGYLVLLPNSRGDLGYAYDFAMAGAGQPQSWYEDLDDGIETLIAQGWANSEQLGIIGHSAGGAQLSYALMGQSGRRFKAAISSDSALLADWMSFALTANADPNGVMEGFWSKRNRRELFDPYRISTPLLVRWGDLRDYFAGGTGLLGVNSWGDVRMLVTKKLWYVHSQTGVPLEVIFDQDAHIVGDVTYALEYQSRVVQWFDYYVLGKGESPIPAMRSPLGFTSFRVGTPQSP